jgi:hypothetical protein
MEYHDRHVLVTHIGLGDAIIQSGLAVALLQRYQALAFPCYPNYLESVKTFFINEPRIVPYTVPRIMSEDFGSPSDQTYLNAITAAGLNDKRQIRLGVYSGRGIGWDFTKDFYMHANVDYVERWRSCPIPGAWQFVNQVQIQEYRASTLAKLFLHDDQSRNFNIHRGRIGRGFVLTPAPDFKLSVLRYAEYMMKADEIHVIDSAFFWLADSLPIRGRLFLHRYARWQRPREFRYETRHFWNYID